MDEPKQLDNPEHISYREYKRRLSKNPHQNLVLFISAFFILLLAFLGVAKLMAPDVDIAIGDEPQVESEQEGIIRGNVDNRLKRLQDEDNGINSEAQLSPELDEKVVIPEQKPKEEPLSVTEENPIVLEKQEQKPYTEPEKVKPQEKPVEQPHEVVHQPPQTPQAPVPSIPKTYKVYVGSYSTPAQAEVAKGILSESGLGVSVFVKNLNGTYTLQAGSYSSQEKAQAVAGELLRNNFPARVVAE